MRRARVGVVEKLINPEARPQLDAENRTAAEATRRLVRQAARRRSWCPTHEALAPAVRHRLGDGRHPEARVPWDRGCSTTSRSPSCDDLHRLVAVLPDLGAERQVPADLRRPATLARRRRKLFDDAQALLDRIIEQKLLTRPRRLRLLAGGERRRRHRRLSPTRPRTRRALPLPRRCGSSGNAKGKRRSTRWPTSSPRSTAARQDYIGAFAVTAGIGCDELAAQFDARPRRLQFDHGQGAGRPAGRSVCRMPARRRPAATGATAATKSCPTTI